MNGITETFKVPTENLIGVFRSVFKKSEETVKPSKSSKKSKTGKSKKTDNKKNVLTGGLSENRDDMLATDVNKQLSIINFVFVAIFLVIAIIACFDGLVGYNFYSLLTIF